MRIAIHASDLDGQRINGTRVYIFNVLKHLGAIDPESEFFIYHRRGFNPKLTPPQLPNYTVKKMPWALQWTQTRFALELLRKKHDRLWMPLHTLPLIRSKNIRITVTVHDLAFKIFPKYFPRKDLHKLLALTDYAVGRADQIIAVSEATKKDLLRFYPKLREKSITVIHHGVDQSFFANDRGGSQGASVLLQFYTIEKRNYILYTGAIQPRKNLITLVQAFESLKRKYPSVKLVFAGTKAWLWEETIAAIKKSKHRKDIVMTGPVDFDDLMILYKNARVSVYPSLYEGFGMPILEAQASGVPVISADNSSLQEVGGDGALYFDAQSTDDLSDKLEHILKDDVLHAELSQKGLKNAQNFSWEKCAAQTLSVIKK